MTGTERNIYAITGAIADSALHTHQRLGPGLLESIYDLELAQDLVRAPPHPPAETTCS